MCLPRRHGRFGDRTEAPKPALLFRDINVRNLLRFLPGDRGPGIDPFLEPGNLGGRQRLLLLRHFTALHQLDHVAGRRIARDHHRALIGAVQHESPEPEVHASFGFPALPMAVETMRLQQRTDVLLKYRIRPPCHAEELKTKGYLEGLGSHAPSQRRARGDSCRPAVPGMDWFFPGIRGSGIYPFSPPRPRSGRIAGFRQAE